MLTNKDIKTLSQLFHKEISLILKKLTIIENKQLTKQDIAELKDDLKTFILYLKKVQIKQEILEEQIKKINNILKASSNN